MPSNINVLPRGKQKMGNACFSSRLAAREVATEIDEPSDLHFAGGVAFVVLIFDSGGHLAKFN